MIILVLLIGGTIYLRTISNAESLDNRNLRELSRIGQGVEGRVNNIGRLMKNLTSLTEDTSKKNKFIKDLLASADLIPHLSIDTTMASQKEKFDQLTAGRTAFKTDLTANSLELWHTLSKQHKIEVNSDTVDTVHTLRAAYSFESLRPTLSSEYMETIFLANEKGAIFIWETERTGVRIHELAALDTLQFKQGLGTGGIGKSDILQTSIAGQEYRFYLLPIRVHLSEMQDSTVLDSEYTKWILGGLVPQSEYRQQSLALDPNMAMFLGFLLIAGFLIVPFVRIFTMGPKERLRVGNLFYLVIALIFGSGLAGLWLADVVHFSPFKKNVHTQLEKTANQLALNIDQELQAAIEELEKKTKSLNEQLSDSTIILIDSIRLDSTEFDSIRLDSTEFDFVRLYSTKFDSIRMDSNEFDSLRLDSTEFDSVRLYRTEFDTIRLYSTEFDSISMKNNMRFDSSGTYPFYHMVFWADSAGQQIAKWTPRANNTPRISVAQREYFRAIHQGRGWDQRFHTNPNSTPCEKTTGMKTGNHPYYVESIRSWTTGENLAAISIPWEYADSTNEVNSGIAAITTELASLSKPVLPTGVGFAIVDANALTQFHIRPERILDENFAEETSNEDLLRSVLAARSCSELELHYEGQNKLIVIRPLNGRPLYLILFKDLSLIDTVRFEAWFEGGALFGLWVLLILFLIFIRERLPSSRMDWLWPDLDHLEKYTIFTIYSLPFILLFMIQALTEEHLHIHPAILVIPVLYLGLGLMILSQGTSSDSNDYKSILGWALFASSILLIGWLTFQNGLETTLNEILAIAISLMIIYLWLSRKKLQEPIKRWSNLSPRGVYTAAMVSGLLVLGLLPGYLTYRFTFHDHSEHLVKYHQLELSESLQNRYDRVGALMKSTWEIDNWWELMAHFPAFSVHNYDLAYENLIFRTNLQPLLTIPNHDNDPETDLHDHMHGLLGNHIPFLTDASIRMRQLSSQQADRSWASDHHDHLLQLSGVTPELLTSELPIARSWLNPLRIAILLTVLGLLCLIVYRVSRWVFFVHLEHSKPLTLENVIPKPGETWRSTILVGTRSISREPLRKRSPEIHFIDLNRDVDKPGDIRKLLNKPLPDETKVLCLDYFDHRIDENERNLFLLELLEKNMTDNHSLPVLLITSRNPDECLLTANMAEEKKETLKHRWDRVLGRFSKILLSDLVSEEPFKTQLRLRIIQKIADDMDKLIIDLNKTLKEDSSEEKTAKLNKLLAKLASRSKWLSEELQTLANPAITLTREQQGMADQFKNRQEIIRQETETIKQAIAKKKTSSEKLTKQNPAKPGLLSTKYFKKDSIKLLAKWEMEARREVIHDKKTIHRVRQMLIQECGHHQRLQEIGEQLTYRPDWHSLTKQEIIDLVREGGEAYYRARWAILSDGERLVAAQLSRGAVINPKSHQAISRLFARGLIRKSPELRLDNSSFSDFVKNTVSEDQLHSWERAGIPSKWEMIRAPLVIALLIIALFLFWSQREFMGNTIAFLGTIGVGVGAIINLLSKIGSVTGKTELKNLEK